MTAYERKLNEIVDDIFVNFSKMTLQEIATKSKLAVSTVRKLEQRVTKLPRFKTVYQLARAAGFNLEINLDKRIRLKAI